MECKTCGSENIIIKADYWECLNCGQDSINYALLDQMDIERDVMLDYISNGGNPYSL